uniref:Uncharacterized protein n=1 Tax=Magallana gigas TaxID=29159 RepID=A0A8W8MD67_MAGGI
MENNPPAVHEDLQRLLTNEDENPEVFSIPTPKKQMKLDNLGRVRHISYAKSDARKPKSTKQQPHVLESSETVSLPATDSHSSVQFNTDSEKHDDCGSNLQSPIRK